MSANLQQAVPDLINYLRALPPGWEQVAIIVLVIVATTLLVTTLGAFWVVAFWGVESLWGRLIWRVGVVGVLAAVLYCCVQAHAGMFETDTYFVERRLRAVGICVSIVAVFSVGLLAASARQGMVWLVGRSRSRPSGKS